MAELYSIRAYYNTGFDVNNRPSNPGVLASAQYRDFESNYLWQNFDITKTRIKSSWADIQNCDYVRIGSEYFIVTGCEMLSGMTAELSLSLDPVISAGGVQFLTDVAGWTERAHVASQNDTLFGNILPEPWAPSNELVLDMPEKIGPWVPSGSELQLVQSTVELDEVEHTAEAYDTIAENPGDPYDRVVVPSIPPAGKACRFTLNFHSNLLGFNYPVGSFYDWTNEDVKNAVNDVRSLGIEGAIINGYIVPSYYVASSSKHTGSNGFSDIVGRGGVSSPSSRMNYRYGGVSVHNNKVYALNNTYTLISSCSGEKAEFRADDLFANTDVPKFVYFADLSPDGQPFIQPEKFRGSSTEAFQHAIAGNPWLKLPLTYNTSSGVTKFKASKTTEGFLLGSSYGTGSIASYIGLFGSGISPSAGSAAAGVVNTETGFNAAARQWALDVADKKVVAPEVVFPETYGAQAYLGNTFYVYRTRLSDNDMIRADNFLTQFGYAQDKKFEISDLTNRSQFNFIKTRGANVKCSAPLRIRQGINDLFNNGVRLWHVLPNSAALTNNP